MTTPIKLYDLARMTTATTLTGTITLGTAVSGFLTFALAGVSDGESVRYAIRDGANSEVGIGVYTAAGTTLTRGPIKSTNSNAAISLSGTAEVAITAIAEDLPRKILVVEGDSRSNPGPGTFGSAFNGSAPYYGQWVAMLTSTSSFWRDWLITSVAVNADTAANIATTYTAQIAPFKPRANSSDQAVMILWAGRNDQAANARTAAQIYADLKTTWAAAKADGFKVVACTEIADSTATKSVIQALNVLIRSDATLYDVLADLDDWLTDSADTWLYQADGTHQTVTNGAIYMARKFTELLGGATYRSPANARIGMPGGIGINGACEVSEQNGSTAGTTTGYYPAEKFSVNSAGTMTFSAAQVADAPLGLTKSIKVTLTGAQAVLGVTDALNIQIRHEGNRCRALKLGTAGASWGTVCFFTKAHVPATYGFVQQNSAANRSYPTTFSSVTADVWEFQRLFIPPDITGTWLTDTGIGARHVISLAAGSTLAGTAGAWAASNFVGTTGQGNFANNTVTTTTFQMTGFLFLEGVQFIDSATAIKMMRDFETEQFLCRREARLIADYALGRALNAAFLQNGTVPLFPPMRAAITQIETTPTPNYTASTGSVGTVQFDEGGTDFVSFKNLSANNWTAASLIHVQNAFVQARL